jgi:hypothetical protein
MRGSLCKSLSECTELREVARNKTDRGAQQFAVETRAVRRAIVHFGVRRQVELLERLLTVVDERIADLHVGFRIHQLGLLRRERVVFLVPGDGNGDRIVVVFFRYDVPLRWVVGVHVVREAAEAKLLEWPPHPVHGAELGPDRALKV